MNTYQEAFDGLNAAQRQAVTTIEGPVLVIAGPGTGKTQLLGVRVAHILQKTDTLPQNILCLTFTENGASNMRERLTRFIGKEAYDVNIGTYHSFGGDLIRRFPEVFAETRLQSPADELTKRQILREIVEGLSYHNPLKQLRHHVGDLIGTLSEVKRALLTSDDLRALAAENAVFIAVAGQQIQDVLDGSSRLPTSAAKAMPLFTQVLEKIQPLVPVKPVQADFGSLGQLAVSELEAALEQAETLNKSTPLTKWKNAWLAKDDDNNFIFDGALKNQRIDALADVFDKYQAALAEHGWYDFDDMILRAIEALEKNPDLRYTLQEQYLYLLLDEFQDTNAAQLRLVELLSDSPVHEGRPNVLAVGDDDQAIYAFQGAQYSNMLDFYKMYRDVRVVNLTQNYRSSADILITARNISTQIDARLEKHFDDMSKELVAANAALTTRTNLERREFQSDVAQYDWIAQEIKKLIDQGTSPSEIAVLAPKHRQLEPLVPYLAELEVPMRYEKRENILEAPVVRQLITMSKLVIALNARNFGVADALWPEVLSFDFWKIPTQELWQLSWQVSDAPREEESNWSKALLAFDKPFFHTPTFLMLGLAGRLNTETCEQILDALIGTTEVLTNDETQSAVRSPLREFYTGEAIQHSNPELFYDTISHLTVLRARLRDFEATHDTAFSLHDLIRFVEMYEAAEERLLNTSPYNQQADAVQLMTVFKAKGLEFEHVFLPSCQDEVWGSSSRGNSNKLTLPTNLAPIRHAGANDDERLRILFVAVTRAKFGLHLTSFARTFAGKNTKFLKYLNEQEQADGSVKSLVLPENVQIVQPSDHTAPTLESLELNWRHRHIAGRGATELSGLLHKRLENYQLSPTHLTTFIDLEYGGPDQFFFKTLLRFPEAPTANSQYGNSVHAALEWVQHRTDELGYLPTTEETTAYFAEKMKLCKLPAAQMKLEIERGEKALKTYLAKRGQIFRPGDKAEHNFKREGVFVGDVHMAGKVDRMEIDTKNRVITVVDYKTGKSHAKWGSEMRLHKYALQLYAYKALIEGSHTYRSYKVTTGRIEFVEPDSEGRIHYLDLPFDEVEYNRIKKLMQAVWQKIHALDFPDITAYDANLTGIKHFENDLLELE
ncbi:MAG: ATP-dependent DNA helicase [Candidatus Saccharimonadales bacterium]